MGYISVPIIILINSTMLIILHGMIAGFGFSFELTYEANPDPSLFAKIGQYTWLIITPILYLVIIFKCISLIVAIAERKNNSEPGIPDQMEPE